MSERNADEQRRLLELASLIAERKTPLGIGLDNECWAGVAISIARTHNVAVTNYYGLSLDEVQQKITLNNQTPPEIRNQVMLGETLNLAFS